jgi:hypothetical protein
MRPVESEREEKFYSLNFSHLLLSRHTVSASLFFANLKTPLN